MPAGRTHFGTAPRTRDLTYRQFRCLAGASFGVALVGGVRGFPHGFAQGSSPRIPRFGRRPDASGPWLCRSHARVCARWRCGADAGWWHECPGVGSPPSSIPIAGGAGGGVGGGAGLGRRWEQSRGTRKDASWAVRRRHRAPSGRHVGQEGLNSRSADDAEPDVPGACARAMSASLPPLPPCLRPRRAPWAERASSCGCTCSLLATLTPRIARSTGSGGTG